MAKLTIPEELEKVTEELLQAKALLAQYDSLFRGVPTERILDQDAVQDMTKTQRIILRMLVRGYPNYIPAEMLLQQFNPEGCGVLVSAHLCTMRRRHGVKVECRNSIGYKLKDHNELEKWAYKNWGHLV